MQWTLFIYLYYYLVIVITMKMFTNFEIQSLVYFLSSSVILSEEFIQLESLNTTPFYSKNIQSTYKVFFENNTAPSFEWFVQNFQYIPKSRLKFPFLLWNTTTWCIYSFTNSKKPVIARTSLLCLLEYLPIWCICSVFLFIYLIWIEHDEFAIFLSPCFTGIISV